MIKPFLRPEVREMDAWRAVVREDMWILIYSIAAGKSQSSMLDPRADFSSTFEMRRLRVGFPQSATFAEECTESARFAMSEAA